MMDPPSKPLVWVGPTRRDFQAMPPDVKSHMGYALYVAQMGGQHRDSKPLTRSAAAMCLRPRPAKCRRPSD